MPRTQPVVTEAGLVERARRAVEGANWVVGECASEWHRLYARGRTDADFARMIGVSRRHVQSCRAVWDRFRGGNKKLALEGQLSWTHYREALSWPNAEQYLRRAASEGASVAQMRRWWQADHKERSTEVPRMDRRRNESPPKDDAERAPQDDRKTPVTAAIGAKGPSPSQHFEPPSAGAGGSPVLHQGEPVADPAPAPATAEDTQPERLFGIGPESVVERIDSLLSDWEKTASAEDREAVRSHLQQRAERLVDPAPPTTQETLVAVRQVVDACETQDEIDARCLASGLQALAAEIHNGINRKQEDGADLPFDWSDTPGDGQHWDEVESEFIQRWNGTEGVVHLTRQSLPQSLRQAFRERWREKGWPGRARQALAKFPLRNGVKMTLRKFLVDTTVDEILGGAHDFDPRSRSERKSDELSEAFSEVFGDARRRNDGRPAGGEDTRSLLQVAWDEHELRRRQIVGSGSG